MATAMALMLDASLPRRRVAQVGVSTAALAWMAVQAHLSAIFVAAPLLAALALQPFYESVLHDTFVRSFYDAIARRR